MPDKLMSAGRAIQPQRWTGICPCAVVAGALLALTACHLFFVRRPELFIFPSHGGRSQWAAQVLDASFAWLGGDPSQASDTYCVV